jgi:hypothetical protein
MFRSAAFVPPTWLLLPAIATQAPLKRVPIPLATVPETSVPM